MRAGFDSRGTLWGPRAARPLAMASPLLPALAAGALLALLAQIPPSLNAAQRWWPVVLRSAINDLGCYINRNGQCLEQLAS